MTSIYSLSDVLKTPLLALGINEPKLNSIAVLDAAIATGRTNGISKTFLTAYRDDTVSYLNTLSQMLLTKNGFNGTAASLNAVVNSLTELLPTPTEFYMTYEGFLNNVRLDPNNLNVNANYKQRLDSFNEMLPGLYYLSLYLQGVYGPKLLPYINTDPVARSAYTTIEQLVDNIPDIADASMNYENLTGAEVLVSPASIDPDRPFNILVEPVRQIRPPQATRQVVYEKPIQNELTRSVRQTDVMAQRQQAIQRQSPEIVTVTKRVSSNGTEVDTITTRPVGRQIVIPKQNPVVQQIAAKPQVAVVPLRSVEVSRPTTPPRTIYSSRSNPQINLVTTPTRSGTLTKTTEPVNITAKFSKPIDGLITNVPMPMEIDFNKPVTEVDFTNVQYNPLDML
ncbi:hypothetical protein D3C87_868840 [compost metagenome]